MGVGGLPVGDGHPCFIIAEIGQNHQGDVKIAKEMIVKAKECGADCVKFQKSSLFDKFTPSALEDVYDSPNSFGKTYGEHKAKLELSEEAYKELQKFAESVGILFTASAMDMVSADFLLSLNVPFIKIGSGDTNNFLLLEHVAKFKKPIFLSTGMQSFETVKNAVNLILKHHSDLVILHCVSSYPTALKDVNLSIMQLYKTEFPNIPIGYSGHELGGLVAVAAFAAGAKVIEKHFTLDRNLKGTDHQCSLDPTDFATMVRSIRSVEIAMGHPMKVVLPCEMPCKEKLGKSLVAASTLMPGTVLKECHLLVKVSRPRGIDPGEMWMMLGKRVNREIQQNEPLQFRDIL